MTILTIFNRGYRSTRAAWCRGQVLLESTFPQKVIHTTNFQCTVVYMGLARLGGPTSPKSIKQDSIQCKNQDKNLATRSRFDAPEECGAAALFDGDCAKEIRSCGRRNETISWVSTPVPRMKDSVPSIAGISTTIMTNGTRRPTACVRLAWWPFGAPAASPSPSNDIIHERGAGRGASYISFSLHDAWWELGTSKNGSIHC
jgi:hypothetical protein